MVFIPVNSYFRQTMVFDIFLFKGSCLSASFDICKLELSESLNDFKRKGMIRKDLQLQRNILFEFATILNYAPHMRAQKKNKKNNK